MPRIAPDRPSRRRRSPPAGPAALKPALDRLYAGFNRDDSASDPVHLVRPYADPADREVAGFIAAGLAFGRVAGLMASIRRALEPMGSSPAAFVDGFDLARDRARHAAFTHRWIRGADLTALLWVLHHMRRSHGSIEGFFLAGFDPASPDVGAALESFSRRANRIDVGPVYGRRRPSPGVAYFFPRPSTGGACKRLNLYLRWMVRRDAIDFGVWTRVPASALVVPLDTHIVRVGRCLGLTRYRSPGWRMAADITASLRAIDPADPVRYDFALCHLGMHGLCGFGTHGGDRRCPLRGRCRPGLGGA